MKPLTMSTLWIVLSLVGVGIWMTYVSSRWHERHWPATLGTVSGLATRNVPMSGGTGVEITVYYDYTVAMQSFRGDRFSSMSPKKTVAPQWVEAKRREYANGTHLDVFYNPSDPSVSVLFPARPNIWSLFVVPGLICCVSGVLAAALSAALGRSRQQNGH